PVVRPDLHEVVGAAVIAVELLGVHAALLQARDGLLYELGGRDEDPDVPRCQESTVGEVAYPGGDHIELSRQVGRFDQQRLAPVAVARRLLLASAELLREVIDLTAASYGHGGTDD